MTKKSKYSSQKWSEKDKDILDKAILKYIVNFHVLFDRYPNPKDYAFEEGYKSLDSDKDLLTMISINFLKKNPNSQPFQPKDLKKHLSNELNDYYENINESPLSKVTGISNTITSRELNEKILKKFIDDGILINFLGKKKFKKFFPSSRGRKLTSESEENSRGKRSIYFVTEDIEQLMITLKKPESKNYIYKKLIKTTTIPKIIRYTMISFFHVLKIRESRILQLFQQSSIVLDYKLTPQDIDYVLNYCQQLKDLDDETIEAISDKATEDIIKNKDILYAIVPLFGFATI